MDKVKFDFSIEFQFEVLRFICKDRDGSKALALVKEGYLELLPHAVIYRGISDFYKKFKRVPGEIFLKDELRLLFKQRDFNEALSFQDQDSILLLVKDIFNRTVRDGDILLRKVAEFASYAEMKSTLESIELDNFNSYKRFSEEVQKALRIADTQTDDLGTLLLKEIRQRQVKRRTTSFVVPTPFRQINNLTNAGGYAPGSIIVILDKPKNLKSAMLINWARGYLRQKKKVLYIDMENGRDEIVVRLEQSLAGVTKQEILEGTSDKKVQKILRRYNRLGGEVYIQRLPAYSTSADISALMEEVYRTHGIRFDSLIIDYIGIMGSLSRKFDDKDRISDAYLDIANLALQYKLDHVVTAHHITREGEKREVTKYRDIDIAKCIDIIRHAQAIFGLNRSPEEKEAEIIRMEIVAQRDGVPNGRALFISDIPVQKINEMTIAQESEYQEIIGKTVEDKIQKGGDI
jgi:hypothetical protein